ncbi:MAG: hypothetical protein MJ091_06760, partial [Clostridia bacterium]|nr:hypothetical protein [Clostridia bacterium]
MASSRHSKRASKNTEGFARILIYFISYFIILLVWETVMCFQTDGGGFSIWTVLFLPSEAMFLTLLSGWFKNKKVNAAVDIIVLIPVTAYYIAQLVYHNIFGSFFSVSMMGMGTDAVGNFGWGMGSAIAASIGALIIILLPVAAWILVRTRVIRQSTKYSGKLHAAVAVFTLVLWFFTVILLPIGGKEQFSAYNAYHGDLVDTDTASSKIGVLTNSIVETYKM